MAKKQIFDPAFKPAFAIDLRSGINPQTGYKERAPEGVTSFSAFSHEEEKDRQIKRLGREGEAYRAVVFEVLNRRPCPANARHLAGTTYVVRPRGSSIIGTITLSKNPAYDLGKYKLREHWELTRLVCSPLIDLPRETLRLKPGHVLAKDDIVPEHGGTNDAIVRTDRSVTGAGQKKKNVFAVTRDAFRWLFEPKYPESQP